MSGIMFVGDSHGNTDFMVRALKKADGAGVRTVIQCGDYGFWPVGRFPQNIDTAAFARALKLYVVRGNHDDHDFLDAIDVYTDGKYGRATQVLPRAFYGQIDGFWIASLGGATSIDREGRIEMMRRGHYPIWWPQEAVRDTDVDTLIKAVAGRRVDVLVTHDAPMPPPIASGNYKRDPDSTANQNRIMRALEALRPSYLIHGHWHMRYTLDFEGTRVVGLSHESLNGGLYLLDTERI